MKLTKSRSYKVNMGNYESFGFDATVEIDNTEYPDLTIEDLTVEAHRLLTIALSKDLDEAKEVTLTRDSFILTMEL